jgi:predicted metal-dependent HD superfamily phosphohydrolase
MKYKKIVNDAGTFVVDLFADKISPELSFHNLNHTFDVVRAVKIIGLQSDISETDLYAIEVAALFHDCGYSEAYVGHEEISKTIAIKFLTALECADEFIRAVEECIEATKYPQRPIKLKAEILCDADMYHFTKPNYPQYAAALRKEHEIYLNKVYSDAEWVFTNYELLFYHKYFIDYGKTTLEQFKQINIEKLRSQLGI